jgi:hypothetical protein
MIVVVRIVPRIRLAVIVVVLVACVTVLVSLLVMPRLGLLVLVLMRAVLTVWIAPVILGICRHGQRRRQAERRGN